MSKRAELEAALAKAEAAWRRAGEGLDRARADRASADAGWDKVVNDRRRADTDRRKPDSVWDHSFPDRRKPGSDRRSPESVLAAFSQAVSDRHKAYLAKSKAEADLAAAESRLNEASAVRNKVIAALGELNRAERKS